LLEFLDQEVFEMQLRKVLGEWVEENLVKDSQGGAVKLRHPPFGFVFAGDAVMGQALQADVEEEFLVRDVGIRSGCSR
jgi:hypothetical protein